jgi:2-hydroxycyclohexanecarboxyl-CoA dehydrogenase
MSVVGSGQGDDGPTPATPGRTLFGRRALVTGGAQGIGEAIARRLAADGAEVVIVDRDGGAAEAVSGEIAGRAATLDITDADAVERTVAALGPFAILVNNAGVDDFGFFTDQTPERWRRVLAVNLEGTFACTRAVLPAMQAARHGRIINMSSEAGRIGSKGNAVYAATKGALIAFTKSLARENARYAVTVNAVAPGPIETPMLEAVRALPGNGPKIVEAMRAATQLGRLGRPEEIAAAVAFLASDEAAFITGETLGVSGGMGIGG